MIVMSVESDRVCLVGRERKVVHRALTESHGITTRLGAAQSKAEAAGLTPPGSVRAGLVRTDRVASLSTVRGRGGREERVIMNVPLHPETRGG